MTARTSSASEATDALEACAGLTGRELGELLSVLEASDVVELELSFGASHLTLSRAPRAEAVRPPAPPETSSLMVDSPLVGIFHPRVEPGEFVQQGQAIASIESLGMSTTVDAPASGEIDDLLVSGGSAVEYGQPLLTLRRARE